MLAEVAGEGSGEVLLVFDDDNNNNDNQSEDKTNTEVTDTSNLVSDLQTVEIDDKIADNNNNNTETIAEETVVTNIDTEDEEPSDVIRSEELPTNENKELTTNEENHSESVPDSEVPTNYVSMPTLVFNSEDKPLDKSQDLGSTKEQNQSLNEVISLSDVEQPEEVVEDMEIDVSPVVSKENVEHKEDNNKNESTLQMEISDDISDDEMVSNAAKDSEEEEIIDILDQSFVTNECNSQSIPKNREQNSHTSDLVEKTDQNKETVVQITAEEVVKETNALSLINAIYKDEQDNDEKEKSSEGPPVDEKNELSVDDNQYNDEDVFEYTELLRASVQNNTDLNTEGNTLDNSSDKSIVRNDNNNNFVANDDNMSEDDTEVQWKTPKTLVIDLNNEDDEEDKGSDDDDQDDLGGEQGQDQHSDEEEEVEKPINEKVDSPALSETRQQIEECLPEDKQDKSLASTEELKRMPSEDIDNSSEDKLVIDEKAEDSTPATEVTKSESVQHPFVSSSVEDFMPNSPSILSSHRSSPLILSKIDPKKSTAFSSVQSTDQTFLPELSESEEEEVVPLPTTTTINNSVETKDMNANNANKSSIHESLCKREVPKKSIHNSVENTSNPSVSLIQGFCPQMTHI